MSKKTVTYSITLAHAEARQAPLDRAIFKFEDRLRKIGYTKVGSDLWDAETAQTPAVPTESDEALKGEVVHKGGGYYDVIVDGEVVATRRGREAAEAALT